ncbi:hypothetical protein [Vibrio phage pTD1]|uniref:Uncharacterized protein n=1 Tax=Vibrio phage pTD1 TaxID=1938577 RepID=A0A1Q2U2W9_9CAUD|nr:hypothetical protein FDH33_gp103 [Vibrio phage pTD1]BAW98312.1 hypothetical protein [Vibrio phage pTD1]
MEMSKTTKARLVTAAATAVNATVAATIFDSKGIAAYHGVIGAAQIAVTEVPEDFDYDAKAMAIHGASMVAGGTIASALIKVVANAIFSGDSTEEESTTEEINEMITELTGLEPEDD